MAANSLPFMPNATKTKTLSVTTTTASVTLDTQDVQSASNLNGGHQAMRIANAGTKVAFVRYGVGTQSAVITDMPVLPGATEVFGKPLNVDTVAAICGGADTTTLYITCGEGL